MTPAWTEIISAMLLKHLLLINKFKKRDLFYGKLQDLGAWKRSQTFGVESPLCLLAALQQQSPYSVKRSPPPSLLSSTALVKSQWPHTVQWSLIFIGGEPLTGPWGDKQCDLSGGLCLLWLSGSWWGK